MRRNKRTFWFEYEWSFAKAFWFCIELLFIGAFYAFLCWLAARLGGHRNLWPFFPLYVIAFNIVSVVQASRRRRNNTTSV